jgi:glucose/mannose-6-phosphate isomerase
LIDLDDIAALNDLDSFNVLEALEGFGAQCREASTIGLDTPELPQADGIDSIVLLGMGGSGAAGDVVQAIVEPRLPVPLRVIKGYGPLPEWVGRNTLVIAISYTGNTDETLSTLTEAHDRGARLITVGSGGQISEMAREFGAAHISLPAGLQPRLALGYLSIPPVLALAKMGLVPDPIDDIEESISVIEELVAECHRKTPSAENPAKNLALKLVGKVCVIDGTDGVGAAIAQRFKSDLNESGKALAFWNALPELDHNEIVGWSERKEIADHFVIVMILDQGDDEAMSERWAITKSLVEDSVDDVIEIETEGNSVTARLLATLFLLQIVAVYTALASGSDPGDIAILDEVKSRLAELKGERAAYDN